MNKIKGIILFTIIGTVLISSTIVILNWKAKKKEIIRSTPKGIDLSIKNLHYTETKKGIKSWELIADSANHVKSKGITIFNNFKVTFFTKDGKKHFLTGDKGEMKDDTKDLNIEGNIVATLDGGYTIKTKALRYDSKESKIFGDDKVYINGPHTNIVGTGLLIEINEQKFTLLRDVKTIIVR